MEEIMYLYLTNPEWVTPWVEGGEIPLNLASAYRGVERKGIITPDENDVLYIRELAAPAAFRVQKTDNPGRNVVFQTKLPDGSVSWRTIDLGFVDGLVVCLTLERNDELWYREAGKRACVEIVDHHRLGGEIMKDLFRRKILPPPGLLGDDVGECRPCEYTETAQRNIFLKGRADEWQKEYRMFFLSTEPTHVTLPPGIGRVVWEREP
jgi:hypothetical protein